MARDLDILRKRKLHQPTGNWIKGLTLALITVVLWGLVPIALHVVLKATDIYTINWFRFIGSFTILSIYLAATRQLPKPQQLATLSPWLCFFAIAGLAGNYYFFVAGLQATSPSHAEVLIQLAGFFFGLGGIFIFKETFTRQQWLGAAILSAGFTSFFHEQIKAAIAVADRYIWGSILLVIGAISWSIYAIAQKQLLKQLSSVQIMWLIYGCCALFFGILSQPGSLTKLNFFQWYAIVFCALNTVIAYGCFAESLQHWEASRVSATIAMAPIFTIVGVTLLHPVFPQEVAIEKINTIGIIGALLVVIGSIVIAIGKRQK